LSANDVVGKSLRDNGRITRVGSTAWIQLGSTYGWGKDKPRNRKWFGALSYVYLRDGYVGGAAGLAFVARTETDALFANSVRAGDEAGISSFNEREVLVWKLTSAVVAFPANTTATARWV
jgi:hypothetical protein